MEEKLVVCDTNILIDVMRNNKNSIDIIKGVNNKKLAVSTITVGELLWGARDKTEYNLIHKSLSNITWVHINENICKIFIELTNKYCLSHNIGIADTFIASTCIYYNYELLTLNLKDFHFIENLRLYNTKK